MSDTPEPTASIAGLLPGELLLLIEAGINKLLSMDVSQARQLQDLQAQVVAVEFKGLELAFYVTIDQGQVRVEPEAPPHVDARIIGTPFSLLKMAVLRDRAGLFSGEVQIAGDVELGRRIQKLLDELDIDWEEELSRFTGDAVAHEIGRAARGLRGWGSDTLSRLSTDFGEYLVEEKELLPRRYELEAFLDDVDKLRADVDRLELRVRRLNVS